MKYLKLFIFINLILFVNSCGTIKEGFSNQKKNNSDEFLVEKKSPLVMPPDYNDLPIPEENKNQSNTDENKIKNLVSISEDNSKQSGDLNQSFEKSLLEKINKN